MERADDSYWRFTAYDHYGHFELGDHLRRLGYHCPQSWTKARMLEVAKNAWTSRPDYRSLDKKTLRKFAQGRKLLGWEEASLKELKEMLYSADASPQFHKLMDLPPELRLKVYDLYFASFPDVVCRPTQPPLARISREMRKEVLGHFYTTRRFELSFIFQPPATLNAKSTLTMAPETLLFLYNLSKIDLARLRNLHLDFSSPNRTSKFRWATIDVTLRNNGNPARYQSRRHGCIVPLLELSSMTERQFQRLRACQDQLLQDVEAAIGQILIPIRSSELKMADLTGLVRTVEDVYWATAERIK